MHQVRLAVVPRRGQRRAEQFETAPRHSGDEFITIAEVPIRRSRTDAGPARSIGEGEAGWALLGDQLKRCTQQGLFQIAVVIAARTRRPAVPIAFCPSHARIGFLAFM